MLAAAVDAALATRHQAPRLARVAGRLERAGLSDDAGRELLLRVWEQALARLLGDVGIDLDREAALLRYAHHFDLETPS